ncbi:MAG: cytochrome c biogenesis CcdA family protein, partial [Candidatus Hydrothermarchaeaceae archaeon]
MSASTTPSLKPRARAFFAVALLVVVMIGLWLFVAVRFGELGFRRIEVSGGGDAGADDMEERVAGFFAIRDSILRYAHSANMATDFIETSALFATPVYWQVTKTDPERFGLDPEKNHVFLVMLDTHFDELPYVAWENVSLLRVDGEREYAPVPKPGSKYLGGEFHHATGAVQFSKVDARGRPIIDEGTRQIELIITGLEGPGDRKMIMWKLPITYPVGVVTALPSDGFEAVGTAAVAVTGVSLATMLAFFAGFIVVLSPCLIHLTAFYVTLMTGITTQELTARRDDIRLRTRVVVSAVLFVSGFAIVYVMAGAVVGSVGQLIRNSETFDAYMRPITIAAGVVIIYFALQVSGVLRLPFMRHLHVPV